jgi:adenylosuccinate lyase
MREHSLRAWDTLQKTGENPLAMTLSADSRITAFIKSEQVLQTLNADQYVGDAPERARAMAATIRQALTDQNKEQRDSH